MLMSASQQIPNHLEIKKPGRRSATDVDTLLRVLCHKKDKYASKFLKIQYQLPKSSGDFCKLSIKLLTFIVVSDFMLSPHGITVVWLSYTSNRICCLAVGIR